MGLMKYIHVPSFDSLIYILSLLAKLKVVDENKLYILRTSNKGGIYISYEHYYTK